MLMVRPSAGRRSPPGASPLAPMPTSRRPRPIARLAPRIRAPLLGGLFGLLLGGCESPTARGRVTDEAGRPLAAVTVSAEGCATTTDLEGAYTLRCPAGPHTLRFQREGSRSALQGVTIEAEVETAVDTAVLLTIPAEPGLHWLAPEGWATVPEARLVRVERREGKDTHRAYCIDPSSGAPATVGPGRVTLFDQQHPGWRPFRLDADGCAWRDTRSAREQWSVDYRGRVPLLELDDRSAVRSPAEGTEATALSEAAAGPNAGGRAAEPKGRLVALDVEEGDYFFADWRGFFVATPDSADPPTYSGAWLRVQAPAAAQR